MGTKNHLIGKSWRFQLINENKYSQQIPNNIEIPFIRKGGVIKIISDSISINYYIISLLHVDIGCWI